MNQKKEKTIKTVYHSKLNWMKFAKSIISQLLKLWSSFLSTILFIYFLVYGIDAILYFFIYDQTTSHVLWNFIHEEFYVTSCILAFLLFSFFYDYASLGNNGSKLFNQNKELKWFDVIEKKVEVEIEKPIYKAVKGDIVKVTKWEKRFSKEWFAVRIALILLICFFLLISTYVAKTS